MLSFIFSSLSFSDWISFIALIISLYSVYYTHKENRHRLLIIESMILLNNSYNPPMICFSVFNDSKSSITITDVAISSLDGKKINFLESYVPQSEPKVQKNTYTHSTLGFEIPLGGLDILDPGRIISPHEYQNPFVDDVVIPPNEKHDFSYYVEKPIFGVKIDITTNQRLRYFKRSQSFVIKLLKSE